MNIDLEKYDEKHSAYIEALAKRIDSIYASIIRQAVKYGLSVNFDPEAGEIFDFSMFPKLKKKIDDLFNDMHSQLHTLVLNGINDEWQFSGEKNDYFLSKVLSNGGATEKQIEEILAANNAAIQERRNQAQQAFSQRVQNGMNLSDRIWKLTDQFKGELEMAIDTGISQGKSAQQISRDIRSYLVNPDKLFRRVRDKHGNLKLSKAAAAYHPGQGVYRSSYKNAMRVARTEVNMAYRSADYENWNMESMVIGIRIRLSNNHTLNGKPFFDICDELKGDYPKNFKFTGWHPQCRCWAVPITPKQEEIIEYTRKIIDGEDVSNYKFKGEIKELPKVFKKWVDQNSKRIDRMKQKPYFIADNENIIYNLTPLQIAEKRHAERTPEQIADIKARWDKRKKENELILKTGKNVINVASDYGEVDYSKLEDYISKKNYIAIKEESKKVAKVISEYKKKEKELSELIPNAHEWHKEFSISELQQVYDAVNKKLAEWEPLSLAQQEKKLKFEAYDFLGGNMKGVQQKYATWKVSQSAYIKKLTAVKYEIDYNEQAEIISTIKKWSDSNPKSKKVASLLLEAEKEYSLKGDMLTLKEKVSAAKSEMDKRIAAQAKREAKKAATTSGTGVFDAKAYTKERKDAAMWAKDAMYADSRLRDNCGKVWRNATKKERNSIFGYTEEYYNINEPLRGLTYYGSKAKAERGLKRIPNIESIINKSTYDFDMWVQRGDDLVALKKFGLSDYNYATDKQIKSLVGKTGVEGAFCSAGVAKGKGFTNKPIIFNIYMPKGTKAMYCEPFSSYGKGYGKDWDGLAEQSSIGGEAEILLQRGTKFKVTKVEKGSDGVWYIDLDVIDQTPVQFPYVGGYPFE